MRIIFLGTAAGVPEPKRNCTCILIDVAGCRYFIDTDRHGECPFHRKNRKAKAFSFRLYHSGIS